MPISSLAGKPASTTPPVNVPRLITMYYAERPDVRVPAQLVSFGTSGHRGSSLRGTFNERHILAITQAICVYRAANSIDGPLFLGFDTHALSEPTFASALEALAGNGVDVKISRHREYTPTPAVSHAILKYNRGRKTGLADGIVITPSHNPPENGGFKYNPPSGGPAGTDVTTWIERRANELIRGGLAAVKSVGYDAALRAATTRRHDYMTAYVDDLGNVIEMDAI